MGGLEAPLALAAPEGPGPAPPPALPLRRVAFSRSCSRHGLPRGEGSAAISPACNQPRVQSAPRADRPRVQSARVQSAPRRSGPRAISPACSPFLASCAPLLPAAPPAGPSAVVAERHTPKSIWYTGCRSESPTTLANLRQNGPCQWGVRPIPITLQKRIKRPCRRSRSATIATATWIFS